MTHSRKTTVMRRVPKSPPKTQWYAVTYIRLFVLRSKKKTEKAQKCCVHQNTVLLKAATASLAYERCTNEIGPSCSGDYKEAFEESVRYDGVFAGIVNVMAIGGFIRDLTEVYWEKHMTTVEKVTAAVPTR